MPLDPSTLRIFTCTAALSFLVVWLCPLSSHTRCLSQVPGFISSPQAFVAIIAFLYRNFTLPLQVPRYHPRPHNHSIWLLAFLLWEQWALGFVFFSLLLMKGTETRLRILVNFVDICDAVFCFLDRLGLASWGLSSEADCRFQFIFKEILRAQNPTKS